MQVLSRTVLAMVFVPGFVLAALVANYLFEQYAIYPTPDKETNVVIACTLGMIVALLVLLVVTKVSTVIAGYRVAHHQFKRSLADALSRRQRSFCIAITAGYFRARRPTFPKDDACASQRANLELPARLTSPGSSAPTPATRQR
jgi:hypothetical protein